MSQNRSRNASPREKNMSLTTAPILTTQIRARPSQESIKSLIDEVNHIKEFCKELKKSHDENCIMQNEKKNFEKMKTEHIKLHADMNIIKEDIKEILGNYQHLLHRVNFLEEENKNLRQHNRNLIKYVQSGGSNIPNYGTGNLNNKNNTLNNYPNTNQIPNQNRLVLPQEDYNHQYDKINVEYSTPLSELSAFNTVHNQSSVEMNSNINNNIDNNRFSKKRFLIPKSDDLAYNY
jgi:chromosome segregation ATPase